MIRGQFEHVFEIYLPSAIALYWIVLDLFTVDLPAVNKCFGGKKELPSDKGFW